MSICFLVIFSKAFALVFLVWGPTVSSENGQLGTEVKHSWPNLPEPQLIWTVLPLHLCKKQLHILTKEMMAQVSGRIRLYWLVHCSPGCVWVLTRCPYLPVLEQLTTKDVGPMLQNQLYEIGQGVTRGEFPISTQVKRFFIEQQIKWRP